MSFKNAAIAATAIASIICSSEGRAQDKPEVIGILLAAGDIAHCGDKPYQRRHEATAALIAKEVADAKNTPIRILPLGDLDYEDGTDDQFECFHGTWGTHRNIMLPIPGNHEY